MNILHSLSFLIITAVCWSRAFADEIQVPASIKGATIHLDGELYYPGDIIIERYEPGKNTARVIIRSSSQLMPRIWEGSAITGATITEGVYGEQVKPAFVTFTGRKGHVYSGTVSGSQYYRYNYRNKEKQEDLVMLKDKKIEIIFPDDNRPVTGSVKGPETLKKGTSLQIQTDERTLSYEIGNNCQLLHYLLIYPNEKEAGIELDLDHEPGNPDISLHVSASDTFEDPIITGNHKAYIVFTEKLLDKIYKGAFFGYLYGYTTDPEIKGSQKPHYTIKFKEKLLSITIILP